MTQDKELTINFLSDPLRKGVTPKLKRLLKRTSNVLQFAWMVYHPLVTELPMELFTLSRKVTKAALVVGSSTAITASASGYIALLCDRDVTTGMALGVSGSAATIIRRKFDD